MNLSDEIENAKKRLAEEQEAFQKGCIEADRLYSDRLDSVFSNYYQHIRSQDQYFIDKILSLKILGVLDELRKFDNLVYSYDYKKVVREKASFFGSKTITEEVSIPIPAHISVHREFETRQLSSLRSSIYSGASIEVTQDSNSEWVFSLTDFRNWDSYRDWQRRFFGSVTDEDFQQSLNERIAQVASMEIPTINGMVVDLLWDYRARDTDFYNTDSVESFSIKITRDIVRIDNTEISISLNDCTSEWVKQRVAEVYVRRGKLH